MYPTKNPNANVIYSHSDVASASVPSSFVLRVSLEKHTVPTLSLRLYLDNPHYFLLNTELYKVYVSVLIV